MRGSLQSWGHSREPRAAADLGAGGCSAPWGHAEVTAVGQAGGSSQEELKPLESQGCQGGMVAGAC